MSAYRQIIGHERQIELLENARRTDRVAHAYLFHGPDGVGKEAVAFAFVKALNCKAENQSHAFCGTCEACQKTDKHMHPDVRLVACEEELVKRELLEPTKGKAVSQQIKNAQLDELTSLFRHRSYLGGWKAVIVVDAERMNTNSQNRFLKTLEEPSEDTVIILVTSRLQGLLPTVLSRCQALAFGPLSRQAVSDFLIERHAVEPQRAVVMADIAQRSLGRAEQLLDDDHLADRDAVIELLGRVRKGDLAHILGAAEELAAGRDARVRIRGYLELMEMWCRDLLLSCLNSPSDLLINQDRQSELDREASRHQPRALLQWMDKIRQTRAALRMNANVRMTVEALLLSMRAY